MASLPPSRGRKHRVLRPAETPDDLLVVIRATPASRDAALSSIAADARLSSKVYCVAVADHRVVLYGVSVFAHRRGTELAEVLARFPGAPAYVQARVGVLRAAGFEVLPTGTNPEHFDVQLISHVEEGAREPDDIDLFAAAVRLLDAAGETRPNPAYAGDD